MAHTKSGGSTKLGRDSKSKRLGVKLYDGQMAHAGQILIRQRGTKVLAGMNVKQGGDDTLYALKDGLIKFTQLSKKRFDGTRRLAKIVNVRPV